MIYTVHPKEKAYFRLMVMISVAIYALIAVSIYSSPAILPFFLLYGGIFFAIAKIASLFLLGYLRGNAIKVGPAQLPEVHALVVQHAQALNMDVLPTVYLLQGNGMLNAFATRMFKRNFIILYSDVLELAYSQGQDAVSFIIGHELGHIVSKHVAGLKRMLILPASCIPFLGKAYGRACEYTCDAIGCALAPQGAVKGLLVLGAGKKLYTTISVKQLLTDAAADKGCATTITEIFSTHPLLINRVAEVRKLVAEDTLADDVCFVSPCIQPEQETQQ